MLFMFVISCVPLLFLLIPVGGDRRIMDVLGGLPLDEMGRNSVTPCRKPSNIALSISMIILPLFHFSGGI